MRSRRLFRRHAVSVPPLKKRPLAFIFILACLVWLSVVPQALGFIVFEHEDEGWDDLNTLITKVHGRPVDDSLQLWRQLSSEQRNNDAALTAAVTEALQIWLQPLREYTDRPIVNDFRYKLSTDWNAADFGIIFYCNLAMSQAFVGTDSSPRIELHRTTNVALPGFMSGLLHEMGHAFGLADTYDVPVAGELGLSKGGLDSTRGTQPSSIMMGASGHREEGMLGRDDKNGIIWLYKVTYEGVSIRDCFFTDYKLENVPLGCVPKQPLIFELKHGLEVRGLRMIEEDKSLDLNAQDAEGRTALHYAVLHEYNRCVKVLLGHKVILGGRVINLPRNNDINANAQDKAGRTALHYAVSHELDKVVEALLAHADIVPFLRDNEGRSALQIAVKTSLIG